ncbi:uncharacterized protein LOC105785335 isoform X2 [Gossypium raimondii]|uniref:uncharacterized protein LOC105785335 isoform X2 n=1 Tax=Gossypium raimondii TaxID=29730 RepID=UPI00227BDA0D|nr:uncharacterized protein LOC105785335 isoform X2 [Gossypium raimondii]
MRRPSNFYGNDKKKESGDDKFDKPISEARVSREECGSNGRNLNKKRSYAQFHLELGQSDFLLHACSICGVKYSPRDEADERNHSIFHKNFTLGVQFRGFPIFQRRKMLRIDGLCKKMGYKDAKLLMLYRRNIRTNLGYWRMKQVRLNIKVNLKVHSRQLITCL